MSGRNVFDAGPSGLFAESGPMSTMLARNWWVIALRGVLGILFGVIALMMPGVTISLLIFWFAVYMLFDGVFAMVAGVRAAAHHARWASLIFEGVVDLAAGATAMLWPIVTLLVFVWIAGGWAIISGILLLSAAFRLHPTHGKWLLALGGIASTLWGVLLLISPISGAVVMTWWLGAYALVFGAVLLVAAFKLRERRQL